MAINTNFKADVTVNIYQSPLHIRSHERSTRLTLGDLHGNAMKLIYFLVAEQVWILEDDAYQKLVSLYCKKPAGLTKKDLAEFQSLLLLAKHSPVALLRFIGDMFSDRGSNDFFTLKIIERLHQVNLPFEILFSNHDFEWIYCYFNDFNTFNPPTISAEQTRSMSNLSLLIEKNLVTKTELLKSLKQHYLPYVKLLAIDNHDLFFHAPNGLGLVKELSKWYGVNYKDNTLDELTATVGQINQAFSKRLMNGDFKDLADEIIHQEGPHSKLIWNRNLDEIEAPSLHNGYHLNYVHGHNGPGKTHPNLTNLDTDLGKHFYNLENNVGDYKILVSD